MTAFDHATHRSGCQTRPVLDSARSRLDRAL